MYWVSFFVLCAFICMIISMLLKRKQSVNKNISNKIKIYICDRRPSTTASEYDFTAKCDNGVFNFTNKVPFPIGSSLEATIKDGKITLFSENVLYNQIFKILSVVEKWRYASILFFIAAAIMALIQMKSFQLIFVGFISAFVLAVVLLLMFRSKNRYAAYCQEEAAGNLINLDYTVIYESKKSAYISYKNEEQSLLVAMIPRRYLKSHPQTIPYHTISKSLVVISKKTLKNINMFAFSAFVLYAILMLISAILQVVIFN